ncbi:MAG: hypothetical protein P0Y53_09010 [Candidatus Pseudobacter hemicellulosilyticus]|uniref:ATP-binding protein n=1 Tax=Candidatus Pseudobacter hemicellulosilyticus TaxID=3121375 RepID=A0AAJ6BJQ3_9BACT|nr:MAG: hypothetical protein P0Y53_09010 [Pseudobacter sp.]
MKNTVGPPARGDNFYQRHTEVDRIRNRIRDLNNIYIAAPRRIGKTSLLFHLLDKKVDDNVYVYVDTEAIDNEADFFRKLAKEVLNAEEIKNSDRVKKLLESGNKFLRKIKGLSIMGTGIDFQESGLETNHKENFENLLAGLEFHGDSKLVLMIDEFPQTIQNIADVHGGDARPAIRFLQANREIRLHPAIQSKVIFIYTGSIGLNHTVSLIGGSAFINDLNALEVQPLNRTDASELLVALLNRRGVKIEGEVIAYILNIIEWLIPFYIQLIAQEVLEVSIRGEQITCHTVDAFFSRIVESRNNHHFEDYHKRIRKHFKDDEQRFALELLNSIAEQDTLPRSVAFDLAMKYNVEEKCRYIIDSLMHDGYINNNGAPNIYRFNSPILRMWWRRFICQ